MFTGIIERLGEVSATHDRPGGRQIEVRPVPPWEDIQEGESIAVCGVCLTVARGGPGQEVLGFDAVEETLVRTTLGLLEVGDRVNLERSLKVGDRLGGHFVTGHIDGRGKILVRNVEGDQVLFRLQAVDGLLALMIPKGSVAVDGISLTVVAIDRDGGWFSFVAVPHTISVTTLGEKKVGDGVNLEVDMLGKWVMQGLREIAAGGLPSMGIDPPREG